MDLTPLAESLIYRNEVTLKYKGFQSSSYLCTVPERFGGDQDNQWCLHPFELLQTG